MKIQVKTSGFDDFHTEIYHICKLFFDQAEVVYTPAVDSEFELELQISPAADANAVLATAVWHSLADGRRRQRSHTRQVPRESEEGRKRALKRAIGYVMLQVLQEATELEQPWGILTGVRPTKLMHNLLRKHGQKESVRILREDYLVADAKARLLADIAERQLQVIPDLFGLDREVSIYLGIPFCPTKCAYCTFPAYDIRGQNGSVEAFLRGLHEEIRQTGEWLQRAGLGITTVYWGGGTPTSIEAEQMDALFAALHEYFPAMDRVREWTVEAGRPDTITPEKINVLKKWNVDRISINPQSFTQATLDAIGRHHRVEEAVDKFKLSREMGMNNINMDLIIGLPNEGVEEFKKTLAGAEELLPESLTVHTLSFKRAAKMTQNRDRYEVAQREEIRRMMEMAVNWTARHGYKPYYLYRQKNILGNLENVGYALPGYDSLYNILMMEERQTIVGLGCGAVSKVLFPGEPGDNGDEPQQIERFANPKEPAVYNQAYRDYTERKLRLLERAYFSVNRA